MQSKAYMIWHLFTLQTISDFCISNPDANGKLDNEDMGSEVYKNKEFSTEL